MHGNRLRVKFVLFLIDSLFTTYNMATVSFLLVWTIYHPAPGMGNTIFIHHSSIHSLTLSLSLNIYKNVDCSKLVWVS